jgi:hypothetical protein
VTLFQEYQRAHQIGRKSASRSEATQATGDQLEVVQPKKSNGADSGRGKIENAPETEFRPPAGSWEGEVRNIYACEGIDGKVKVYLTWKRGQKTQHSLDQVYKRCPQKV